MRNKLLDWIGRVALLLALLQLMLILVSWLWVAASPDTAVRSLLSSGGIRWFFGTFVHNEASPLLVWIVLGTMAVGSIRGSGVGKALLTRLSSRYGRLSSQQSFALKSTFLLFLLEVVAILLLTLPSHAVLLSVTGDLFPSSFSDALIPILAFICVTTAIFYGLLSGRIHRLPDLVECICHDAHWLMPLLIIYVLASELWYSFIFIFFSTPVFPI